MNIKYPNNKIIKNIKIFSTGSIYCKTNQIYSVEDYNIFIKELNSINQILKSKTI